MDLNINVESTSHTPTLDVGGLSSYEDALDESDTELQRLCDDAVLHLRRSRPRFQPIVLPQPIYRPSSKYKARSSSSEHSSIEKVQNAPSSSQFRSRRNTSAGREKRKTRNNGSSSRSESPEEWRMLNFAFQEVTHYPVLVQINQHLQLLSRQLYEIESTNALQLKIIAQLMRKLIKAQRRPLLSLTRFFRALPVLLLALSWPFVARALYEWYLSPANLEPGSKETCALQLVAFNYKDKAARAMIFKLLI